MRSAHKSLFPKRDGLSRKLIPTVAIVVAKCCLKCKKKEIMNCSCFGAPTDRRWRCWLWRWWCSHRNTCGAVALDLSERGLKIREPWKMKNPSWMQLLCHSSFLIRPRPERRWGAMNSSSAQNVMYVPRTCSRFWLVYPLKFNQGAEGHPIAYTVTVMTGENMHNYHIYSPVWLILRVNSSI